MDSLVNVFRVKNWCKKMNGGELYVLIKWMIHDHENFLLKLQEGIYLVQTNK